MNLLKAFGVGILLLVAMSPGVTLNAGDMVTEKRIIAADKEPQNWLTHGRTYDEQRYSPLKQINRETVQRLGIAWYADMETTRGLEATPIVIDGKMYVTGSWSILYALDARTGKLLWKYDPEVPGHVARNGCCDVVNRGIAIWQDKVYLGTFDGRLVALDRQTGAKVWSVLTVDPTKPYTITGAPRIVKNKVIIGNGGAEFGVRGYFSAYDSETGKLVWRFYTVPENNDGPFESDAVAAAAKTWSRRTPWDVGAGGTAWDSMAYDPKLDLLYVGTGNGSPWSRKLRSPGGGDNLYLSSILAVKPDTGELKWHYQTTPGESWDYTATQHMILADIMWRGKRRQVLMQAPKNGFFYVLDRRTGELLAADKYIDINWASGVDLRTGRPIETGRADWDNKSALVTPFDMGGHTWPPMSYNPKTGLVYIPTHTGSMTYKRVESFAPKTGAQNMGLDVAGLFQDMAGSAPAEPPPVYGELQAWDPIKKKKIWGVRMPRALNGGTLTTAGGLVFQGTGDGRFVVYRSDNGGKLWEIQLGNGVIGSPITYSVDGTQYISVLAGWGGAAMIGHDAAKAGPLLYENNGYLYTFALDANIAGPKFLKRDYTLPEPPNAMPQALADKGMGLYHTYCMRCHGPLAQSVNMLPDLRQSGSIHSDMFEEILLDGLLQDRGMASFADLLTKNDVLAIKAYVIDRARIGYRQQQESSSDASQQDTFGHK